LKRNLFRKIGTIARIEEADLLWKALGKVSSFSDYSELFLGASNLHFVPVCESIDLELIVFITDEKKLSLNLLINVVITDEKS